MLSAGSPAVRQGTRRCRRRRGAAPRPAGRSTGDLHRRPRPHRSARPRSAAAADVDAEMALVAQPLVGDDRCPCAPRLADARSGAAGCRAWTSPSPARCASRARRQAQGARCRPPAIDDRAPRRALDLAPASKMFIGGSPMKRGDEQVGRPLLELGGRARTAAARPPPSRRSGRPARSPRSGRG